MTGRSGRLLAVSGLALAAGFLLVAATKIETPPDGESVGMLPADLIRALGLVLLATIAALFASTGWLRRLVGALSAGLCLVVTAISVADWSNQSSKGWAAVVLVGAVLGCLAGLLVAVRGSTWAGWSTRFETRVESGSDLQKRPAQASPTDQWRALDAGDDPTR